MGIFGENSAFEGTVIQARALMVTAALSDIIAEDLSPEEVVNGFVATQSIFDYITDGEMPEKGMAIVAQGLRMADKLGLELPAERPDRIDPLIPIARMAIYRKGGSKRQRNERRAKMLQLTDFSNEFVGPRRRIRKASRDLQEAFWRSTCDTIFAQLRALEEAQNWHRDTMPLPLPRHFGELSA